LIDAFRTAVETVGGTVKVARDYTGAVKIVQEICRVKTIRSAVISRGPLVERLNLKSPLNSDGIAVGFTAELSDADTVKEIEKADLGVTEALVGVAETGTVVIVTVFEADRLASALPPNHIVLLDRDRVIASMEEVASLVEKSVHHEKYTLSLITGPSSTSDIEKILVRGVHGPNSLFIILIGRNESD